MDGLKLAMDSTGSQLRDMNGRLFISAAYPTTSPGGSRTPQFILSVEFSKTS
ncbi:hypothetical protein [Paenibacillus sp. FSL L8-0463]|uniref:hypothetical protein n=1 Tax=Paenibacillus sp. FSL L8-0463 TaxID=2954687 RepID=UPI00311A44D5